MTEGMNVKDYDYDLPEELIAQGPSGGSFQFPADGA